MLLPAAFRPPSCPARTRRSALWLLLLQGFMALGFMVLGAATLPGMGSATAQDAVTEGLVIRFATEGATPPFNFVGADNQLQGFEIDIAKAVCAELRARCSVLLEDWDDLIPGLVAGRFDAIVASLEITEERRQRIGFSRAYYRTPAVFMGRTDFPGVDVSPAGTKGLRLGAMENTAYAAYLEEHYAALSTVSFYANQDEASLDLALGRLDLVLGDKIALAEWLKRGREASCCRFVADAPRDPEVFGEGFGFGLRQDDSSLRRALDDAILAIQADGTYDAIRARYFPFDVK